MTTLKNKFLITRLEALLAISQALDAGGKNLSNASIGAERELFINLVLNNIIAPPFRLGCGDVTDSSGNKSGQCDIIIEWPTSISFPLVSATAPRLYLAEGVCAIIEVKSDLVGQWDQVISSHSQIAHLKRHYSHGISLNRSLQGLQPIPHFIVGYRAWKKEETLREKLIESGVDGILSISTGMYVGKNNTLGTGSSSLLAFLISLQSEMNSVVAWQADYFAYIK